jgi:hypothetical protein
MTMTTATSAYEEDELSLADWIEISAADLDGLARERFGLQVAADALRLCVPVSDAAGWLQFISRWLEPTPDAPAGILRIVAQRVVEEIEAARAGASAQ